MLEEKLEMVEMKKSEEVERVRSEVNENNVSFLGIFL